MLTKRNLPIIAFILFSIQYFTFGQSVQEGQDLFAAKACASCHDKTMTKVLVGPALAGVETRWENKKDLYQWIRNSKVLLDKKHKYATALYEKFNKTPMLPNPDLTDAQIESLLMYVNSVASGTGAGGDNNLAVKGKELFTSKACASCHDINFKTKVVGPNLAGVESRWANKKDLYDWIRNPQTLLDKKHPYATKLFEANNKVPMLANPTLTDDEITALLAFISNPQSANAVASGDQSFMKLDNKAMSSKPEGNPFYSSLWFLGLIALLLFLIVLWLAKIVAKMRVQAFSDQYGKETKYGIFDVLFLNRTVLKFAVFGFIVFGIYFTAIRAIALGRQQNYQPDQPIKYSHVTHAGVNKIDCNFCHDAARRSKHAMIPPTSTCMKCHKAIKVGTMYGTQEIGKIFASIGFDPVSGQYIQNYEKLTNDEIKKIFIGWIKQENKNDDKIAEEQWKNISTSLTNPTKPNIQGPIEWTRIHNLPDHVYFNHSQHVTVGKVACQSCHGPIQEMEVVKQYAPLSMGWCVNCHRQSDVKFDNKYYDNYFAQYHKEIKNGVRKGVKVADIGGIDCQKCHY